MGSYSPEAVSQRGFNRCLEDFSFITLVLIGGLWQNSEPASPGAVLWALG